MAGSTARIRVGPAGVLLRYYAAAAVARDGMFLESTFERIDLGLAGGSIAPPEDAPFIDGRVDVYSAEAFERKLRTVAELISRSDRASRPSFGFSEAQTRGIEGNRQRDFRRTLPLADPHTYAAVGAPDSALIARPRHAWVSNLGTPSSRFHSPASSPRAIAQTIVLLIAECAVPLSFTRLRGAESASRNSATYTMSMKCASSRAAPALNAAAHPFECWPKPSEGSLAPRPRGACPLQANSTRRPRQGSLASLALGALRRNGQVTLRNMRRFPRAFDCRLERIGVLETSEGCEIGCPRSFSPRWRLSSRFPSRR